MLLAAALGLGTVAHTVAVPVPHRRLGEGWSNEVGSRLVRTNWWRIVLWTVGTGCALAMVLLDSR